MDFLNALAVAAIVWFLSVFTVAFRRNVKIGFRLHNVSVNTAAVGLIGVLWLIFGGA